MLGGLSQAYALFGAAIKIVAASNMIVSCPMAIFCHDINLAFHQITQNGQVVELGGCSAIFFSVCSCSENPFIQHHVFELLNRQIMIVFLQFYV